MNSIKLEHIPSMIGDLDEEGEVVLAGGDDDSSDESKSLNISDTTCSKLIGLQWSRRGWW